MRTSPRLLRSVGEAVTMAIPVSTRVASWLILRATIILSFYVDDIVVVCLMRYLEIFNSGPSQYFSISLSCSHEPDIITCTHLQAPEAVFNLGWPDEGGPM